MPVGVVREGKKSGKSLFFRSAPAVLVWPFSFLNPLFLNLLSHSEILNGAVVFILIQNVTVPLRHPSRPFPSRPPLVRRGEEGLSRQDFRR